MMHNKLEKCLTKTLLSLGCFLRLYFQLRKVKYLQLNFIYRLGSQKVHTLFRIDFDKYFLRFIQSSELD